jgi:hypothetical protein
MAIQMKLPNQLYAFARKQTRNGQKNEKKLHHVKPVTPLNLCFQNPLIMAARIFNKLLAVLKVIEEDQIFVRKLKKNLHENMFTTFVTFDFLKN